MRKPHTLGEPFKIYKFNKSDGKLLFLLNTEGNIDYMILISPKVTLSILVHL